MTETVLPRIPMIAPLTGLRAVAALWVVLHHYFEKLVILFPQTEFLRGFARAGNMGVELFFILSGFVITLNYAHRFQTFEWKTYAMFLQARLARIYPVVLVCLLALVPIVKVAELRGMELNTAGMYTPGGFIASLMMVQAWGDAGFATWNFVAWSVSAEWFAYLLFPLTAFLYHRTTSPAAAMAMAFGAMAFCAFAIDTHALKLISPFDHISLLRVAGAFLAGSMMCWLWQHRYAEGLRWEIWTPVFGVAFVALAMTLSAVGHPAHWSMILMAPFVLGLAYGHGSLARLLCTPLAEFWGRASYSLYMTHLILKMVLVKVLPAETFAASNVLVRLGVLLAYLLMIGALATLTYKLVEEPARKKLQPRRPTPTRVTS